MCSKCLNPWKVTFRMKLTLTSFWVGQYSIRKHQITWFYSTKTSPTRTVFCFRPMECQLMTRYHHYLHYCHLLLCWNFKQTLFAFILWKKSCINNCKAVLTGLKRIAQLCFCLNALRWLFLKRYFINKQFLISYKKQWFNICNYKKTKLPSVLAGSSAGTTIKGRLLIKASLY